MNNPALISLYGGFASPLIVKDLDEIQQGNGATLEIPVASYLQRGKLQFAFGQRSRR